MKKILTCLSLIAAVFLIGSTKVYAAEYSEEFKKEIADGVIELPISSLLKVDTKDIFGDEESDTYDAKWIQAMVEKYYNNGNELDSFSCKFSNVCYADNYNGNGTYEIQIKFQEPTEEIKKIESKLEEFMNKMKSEYILSDLSFMNYYNSIGEIQFDGATEFVTELNELKNEYGFELEFDGSLGDGDPFYGLAGGNAIIYYNGVAVGAKTSIYFHSDLVLYIPDTTPNTEDAYIKAANERIKDYIPNSNFKITMGGKLEEDFSGLIDENKYISSNNHFKYINLNDTNGYYYNLVTSDGEKVEILIARKSSNNLTKPEYKGNDLTTGIKVITNDGSVPLDTVLTIKNIVIGSSEHKNIKDRIKTDDFLAFDFSLFSSTLKTNITKLENGEFQVVIPIGIKYVGKNMYAYYIKDDNSIEKHKIVMDKEGNATFNTNHFSTYIIAEELDDSILTNNAQTGTLNVALYSGLAVISLLGIGYLLISKKKNM